MQNVPECRQKNRTSLRTDFGWSFAGNALYAGGQFAALTVLAKLVRPEMVGQYALGLALVYPIMQCSNLQLRAVMTSDVKQQTRFEYYFGLRLFTSTVALFATFGATRLLGYDWGLTAVILTVGVAYGVETVSDVYYARLQLHDGMSTIAKSMMARALLSTIALALVTYISGSVLWAVASVAAARFIVLMIYDSRRWEQGLDRSREEFSARHKPRPRFNLRVQAKLLWSSLPLGIVLLFANLNSSIPTFFIKRELGERDVAVFVVIGFVISVGNMVVVSLGNSAFTRFTRAYAGGDITAFGSLLGKLLAFGAAFGCSGLILTKWAGREILTVLFRPEYAERSDLLPWITLTGAVLFMAQVLGFAMTAANLYHSQVVLNLLANLTLYAACSLLVGRQGLMGAIYAMLFAASVQLLGSVVALAAARRRYLLIRASEIEAV